MKKQTSKKKRNQKLKKKLASMTALVLVLAVGVWGTLAYLSKKTGTKTNTFTGSAGLELGLEETKWNVGEDDKNKEVKYKPGDTILKNPQLYNGIEWIDNASSPNNEIESGEIGKDENYSYNEYVAMRIDFKDASDNPITYTQLKKVIKDITINEQWELVQIYTDSGSSWSIPAQTTIDASSNGTATRMIFLYKGTNSTINTSNDGVVAAGSYTEALFNKIEIRNGRTQGDGAEPICGFNDNTALLGNFPGFKIDVLGAAVEAGGSNGAGTISTVDNAKTELIKLLQ